jgi:hypothetical protein
MNDSEYIPIYCSHRWQASRVEAETTPVNHVCSHKWGHTTKHECSCGAVLSIPSFHSSSFAAENEVSLFKE